MNASRSFLDVLLGWRRLLLRFTVVAAVVAVIVSLLLPTWWTAHATITPPDDSDGGGGLLQLVSQLGGVGGVRTRSLLSRTASIDLVLGVIKSRRLRGQVVDRFDLAEVYGAKSREHAINELGRHLDVSTTPEGLVDVAVEAKDAGMAADIANAFVEFLDDYNRATSVEDAKRTVTFVEARLDDTRQRMERAADSLRRFQEDQGAIELGEQTRATVQALADLEAERTQLEIQRGVLNQFATPDQFQVRDLTARIREIDGKAKALRDKSPVGRAAKHSETALLALGDLPNLALQLADLKRELLVQEKVYEFLTSQLEEARIRESRDMVTVKVLDAATPPIRKTRPRRSLIVLLTTALAFTVALSLAFMAEGALGMERRDEADPWARRLIDAARALRDWGGDRGGSS